MNKVGVKEFSKKGQITIFIIIAIVIVGVIAGFVAFKNGLTIPGVFGNAVDTNIKQIAEACIYQVTLQTIYDLGLQGGYYSVPEPKEPYLYIYSPVYYDKGNLSVPSLAVLERELSDAIRTQINDSCYNSIISISKTNDQIIPQEVQSVSAKMNGSKVSLSVGWPILVNGSYSSHIVNNFKENIDFDFTTKYNIVLDSMKSLQNSPEDIFLSSVIPKMTAQNASLEIIELEENKSLYTLVFNNENYNNRTYVYGFVVRS